MKSDGGVKYQYLAALCANILAISNGAFCGWPSASLLTLQSNESPLETGPMSNDDVGSVVGIYCVGGTVGVILFTFVAEKFGRKRCLLLSALPLLVAWWIIPFAFNPMHLLLSRFFGGMSCGGLFGVMPLYTTEISDDSVRGILGTFLILTCNIGVLFAFVLGYFYTYITVAWISSILTVLFLLLFPFLPETPQYLIKMNKTKEAEKALRYYKNIRSISNEITKDVQFELEKLKTDDQKDMKEDSKLKWSDFNNHVARKALIIGFLLLTLNQFCGCFAMINYTATIFKQSDSKLSPNVAAIIVGVIQLFGSYFSSTLVERAGRKLLLLLSALGAGVGHLCLSGYIYLKLLGYENHYLSWVPVASFSFIIFMCCWGMIPLPFLIISEILPPKIRDIGNMICLIYMWNLSFLILKYVPLANELIGIHGLFLVFGISCFAGAVFVFLRVPETKGKSIETILSLL